MSLGIPRDVVLGVSDLITTPEPLCAVGLILAFGPNARLHAHLVKARGLGKVQDAELDFVGLLVRPQSNVFVDNLEVVPLGMAFGVEVVL